MQWINSNLNQILGLLVVAILLTVGRKPLLGKTRGNKPLMWLAFAVTTICGLILGWALAGVMGWVVNLDNLAGATLGPVGALAAVWAGWHAVAMLVDLIRDVADQTPDEDARRAALWIPTLLPAGATAVWGIVTNPRGLGTGLAAAAMAAITAAYVGVIIRKALAGKAGSKPWKWFAAIVSLLGGLVLTPLVLYVDGWLGGFGGQWQTGARLLAGVLGLSLGVAAAVDIADKVPDRYVRAFLRFGLPMVLAFGAVAVGFITSGATNGGDILTGVA